MSDHGANAGGAVALRLSGVLEDALDLLRDIVPAEAPATADGSTREALLQQCLAMCQQASAADREPVRTLHHFACTGGTLIGKCVAAMPNVQLLSEIDPLSTMRWDPGRPQFAPTDAILQMRQSTRGASEALLLRMFADNLRLIHEDCRGNGQRLVLRDHAHSHFCVGSRVPDRPTLREMVPPDLGLLSVVTVRHPLDSYAALTANGWVGHSPATLDEYCRRYAMFLDRHAGVQVIKYEDFVERPPHAMRQICAALALPFAEHFLDVFDVFHLTGDSGRGGARIEARPRRALPEALRAELAEATAYEALCARLGYAADIPA